MNAALHPADAFAMKTSITLRCVAGLLAAMALSGCVEMLYSDNANAQRQRAAERNEALAGNREASRQALPAQALSGEALQRLLAGKTHVNEYRRRVEDSKPYYTVYDHFHPDGSFQSINTSWRSDPATASVGRWKVAGEVLCITEMNGDSQDHCFTIRQEASGAIQYWIHQPGDPFHGLITSRVHLVRDGPQTPEFATVGSPFRR
ncbi:MAG: hypothetical protein ABL916_24190 [Burkholderiaceae bacterium]